MRKIEIQLEFPYVVPALYEHSTADDTLCGCVHRACYFTNFRFSDLEATMGTYELRSYGVEQYDRQGGP